MSLDYKAYQPTSPGRIGAVKQADLRVPEEDGLCSWLPATVAALRSGQFYTVADMGAYYTAGNWTITGGGGTGGAEAQATTAGGGVKITTPSDSNFDTTLDSKVKFPLASGKRFGFVATFMVSSATGIGAKIGISTGGADSALPFGTNYTNIIGFSKAIASAPLVSTVRGASGTAASSGTLATIVADTQVTVGCFGVFHATTPSLSFYVGTPSGGGTVTAADASQLAQLAAFVSTATFFTCHLTGVTATNPTGTFREILAGVEA